jgi:hypothetical protein
MRVATYTSTPQSACMGWCSAKKKKHRDNFTFTCTFTFTFKCTIFNLNFRSVTVTLLLRWRILLWLTKYVVMDMYPLFNEVTSNEDVLGSGCIAPRILDLGTRWRWVVSFTPDRFTPGVRTPSIHRIGCWVAPRSSLYAVARKKIPSLPLQGIEPRSPTPSLVAVLTELPQILALLLALFLTWVQVIIWSCPVTSVFLTFYTQIKLTINQT